jgi:hypothetical protein
MHETNFPTRTAGQTSWLIALALVAWLGASLTAWYGITTFGFVGERLADGDTPAVWPVESTIVRSKQRPMLLLFLHPHCACSQATVEQLERLTTLVPARLLPTICVVASSPRSTGRTWESTPLLNRIPRLPNSYVFHDAGGVETALFGAQLSGTVILYDTDGRRLYAGGVTMARGHDGHNAGIQAVADLLINPEASAPSVPAFGCSVVREASSRKSEAAESAPANDAAEKQITAAEGDAR